MMDILNFVIANVFRNPPILIGLVAMFGLVLQRKVASEVIKGSMLAVFGMFILQVGVGILVNSILPVNQSVQQVLGGQVASGLNDQTFSSEFGATIGLSMFLAFILHVLIARFTPLKNIFLTGHFLWWIPFIFTAIGVENQLSGVKLLAFATVFSAIYWSVMPFLLRPFVRAVIGDDSFTLAHPSGILALIAGYVARFTGDKTKSTEDVKLPAGLSFFREISITGALIVFLLFVVLGIVFKDTMVIPEGGLVIYAFNQGIMFGAGLTIMLNGVRMIITQLLPAFQGIANKIVPNAVPALDCPILFNYKPNAVLIGFIVAMVTSTIAIIFSVYFNWFGIILIPLIITSFFECGTAAIIAEGQGGLRGAIIGTIVSAVVMVVLMGLSVPLFSHTIANWILIFGGNDLSLWAIIANFFAGFI